MENEQKFNPLPFKQLKGEHMNHPRTSYKVNKYYHSST